MKIYDISQEVLSCEVYPGDPSPRLETLVSMETGEVYNLTALYMSNHNGTHTDAPRHFFKDGDTVDRIPVENFVGMCFVAEHCGEVSAADAENIMEKARGLGAAERILIKGDAVVTVGAAEVFAAAKLRLLGNESQSVGPMDAPMAVHKIMLGAGTVLLEGVRLGEVSEGTYLLSAAPLNIAGAEGAPCRAVLIDLRDN